MLDQKDNLLSSYNYDLPNDLIAQSPTESRHDAKLMIVKDGLDEALNIAHAKGLKNHLGHLLQSSFLHHAYSW